MGGPPFLPLGRTHQERESGFFDFGSNLILLSGGSGHSLAQHLNCFPTTLFTELKIASRPSV